MKVFYGNRLRRVALVPAVLLSIGLGACSETTSPPWLLGWTTDIEFDGEFAEVTGTSTAVSSATAWEAEIQVEGASEDQAFAWQIATGSCAEPGTRVGTEDDYANFTIGANGAGESYTMVTGGLDGDGDYIVLVHDVAGETPVRAGCGEFERF